MCGAMVTVQLDGLEETLRVVIRSEVAQALADAAAPQQDGFLDVPTAAAYLSSTPAAIRAAVKRGQLRANRSETGRVLFTREQLDSFARGSDA